MRENCYEKLKSIFKNVSLFEQALTHSSYTHEKTTGQAGHNERLEFLGDAVLEVIISELLYIQFPDYNEGQLSKFRAGLVCESCLAKMGHELGFEEYLLLGKGEENTGGRYRDAIMADAFEAVIGALYIDGGLECARTFVHASFADEISRQRDIFDQFDNKTFLQESFQKSSKTPLNYIITNESGPDHNKIFTAKVEHKGRILGSGSGKSKKEAEQNAAADAITALKLHY